MPNLMPWPDTWSPQRVTSAGRGDLARPAHRSLGLDRVRVQQRLGQCRQPLDVQASEGLTICRPGHQDRRPSGSGDASDVKGHAADANGKPPAKAWVPLQHGGHQQKDPVSHCRPIGGLVGRQGVVGGPKHPRHRRPQVSRHPGAARPDGGELHPDTWRRPQDLPTSGRKGGPEHDTVNGPKGLSGNFHGHPPWSHGDRTTARRRR